MVRRRDRGRLGERTGGLALAPVVLFVALFALVPAAAVIASGTGSEGGVGPALSALASDPITGRSIENSLLQGGLSAAVAFGLGLPAGVFLGRYRWPGHRAVRSVLLIPFLLPTLVVVLGVLDLVGPGGILSGPVPALSVFGRGIPAVVGANLLYNVPIVVLLTAAACEAAPVALEETAATLGASPARVFRDAWGASAIAGASAGGLLTFLFSALSFAPPLLLCGTRCYTVEGRIWQLAYASLTPSFSEAWVLSFVLVLMFLAPTVAYLALLSRLRARPGRTAVRPRPVPWRSPFALVGAGATLLILAAEAALLLSVGARAIAPPGGGPPGHAWAELFASSTATRLGLPATGALLNTLGFATAAAGLALVLGLLAGAAVARRPRRASALGVLLFVPLLLSPIVVAAGLRTIWLPLLGGLPNTWLLIVIGQTVLALPFALQSLELPLSGLPPAAAESARTLGASRWGAFLDADLPRVKEGLVTATLFAYALGLGEFTATYLLVTPQYVTLPVAVYDLAAVRQFPVADAAAGLLLVLSLAVFAAVSLGGRRVEL
jgi:thiamine transport system permease protein